MTAIIIHQQDLQQFIIKLNEEAAFVRYRLFPHQKSVNFYSTFVPHSARGQGLAQQLAEAAFAWAHTENLTIQTDCSYLQKFLTAKNK